MKIIWHLVLGGCVVAAFFFFGTGSLSFIPVLVLLLAVGIWCANGMAAMRSRF